MKRIDPGGIRVFYNVTRVTKRKVGEEFSSGQKFFYEGDKGVKHLVRIERPGDLEID